MVALTAIHDWVDAPGSVVSWSPSPASLKKVRDSPRSAIPASYQQEQHIRSYRSHSANGLEMARLLIPVWNMPGRCDIRAMTFVINSYLRRHDTYHSWFEFDRNDRIVRHTVSSPTDIEFAATKHGEMVSAQWRDHALATPSPLDWDCFRFGVIQRDDHFTFYASLDHLHADATFMVALFVELDMNYAAVADGGVPISLPGAGSYTGYCSRQRDCAATLELESPDVREWIGFLEKNNGSLPQFPLPLGDRSPCPGDLLTVELLDEFESDRFESACASVGVRFIGGVFACAAIAERELTGAGSYCVITPTTVRSTPAEWLTTGWFTGIVPIFVATTGKSFSEIAQAAQASFDSGLHLAGVPIERVFELAESMPGIRPPDSGVPMLSYLDVGLPPLNPVIIAQWEERNGRLYTDLGAANQIGMWVNRLGTGTRITVAYPDNPVARESVARYVELMKCVYLRVAAR